MMMMMMMMMMDVNSRNCVATTPELWQGVHLGLCHCEDLASLDR